MCDPFFAIDLVGCLCTKELPPQSIKSFVWFAIVKIAILNVARKSRGVMISTGNDELTVARLVSMLIVAVPVYGLTVIETGTCEEDPYQLAV